jgi:methylase of polypeptide subunit release factors
VLSLTDARHLLQDARSDEALRNCAFALGFSRATPVGRDLQEKLGIAGTAESFSVCESSGILRALIVTIGSRTIIRDALITIANRLSSSVPHLLWIVFSTDGNAHVGISVWSRDATRNRVYALLADPNGINDSDVQTLCALASIVNTSDSLTHLRWTEILGREAITIRFFRALRAVIEGLAESISPETTREVSRELALTCVSRLLFLSFVERKGWLNGDHDFLSNSFIQCMTSGGRYHRKVLKPLFFGTLNTPFTRRAVHARKFGRIPFLNGGLFGRSVLERRTEFEFPDDAMGCVFGELLTRYRFTGHEEAADISESAIDPEILGRAFESLMHSHTRKATGAFYTPGPVVQRVADAALEAAFEESRVARSSITSLLSAVPVNDTEADLLLQRLSSLRILDPACGSGAFLVYLLEKIAGMRALCGDTRSPGERRREVLANTIFGVDINPTAVWLCELRLWLSVVVHTDSADPIKVMPLPNLDRNIRVGDSLGARSEITALSPLCEDMRRTRLRYMRSVGTRKKLLGKALEKMERRHAISLIELDLATMRSERNDLLAAARSRNLFGERTPNRVLNARLAELRKLRAEKTRTLSAMRNGSALPFSFETQFADVMSGGGFDLVVGNPPWVRIHQISRNARAAFKRDFELCRSTGWAAGAARAHAGSGFAHQLDLSALFVERSFALLRPEGSIGLLLPGKLWKSLAGGSVRTFVNKAGTIRVLEDFSAAKAIFDAATYPSLLVAAKHSERVERRRQLLQAIVHRRSGTFHWNMSAEMLPLDHSVGSPWLLVPREVRAAFDIVAARGIQMADSHFGRPLLGVKTGSNEVFIHHCVDASGKIAQLGSPGKPIEVESNLLRNVIRGDSVQAWQVLPSLERIIWTHEANGEPLPDLPSLAKSWFSRRRRELAQRTDARNDSRWWRVFRTEAANSSTARVIWSDIGRAPHAVVIAKDDASVPLNTCYALPCESDLDAHALAALINSPLIAAWLSLVAEPAQGGYNRYMGWTMAMLPIPRRWDQCKTSLARLSRDAHSGKPPSASDLFNKSLHAFGLQEDDVQDLMIWTQQ